MGRLEAGEYGDPDDDPSVMRTHSAPAICQRTDPPTRRLWPVGMPMGQLITAAVRSKAGLAVLPTAICSSASIEATALGGVFMRHANGCAADSEVGVYTPAPLGNECL
jgi:hypothetical protein